MQNSSSSKSWRMQKKRYRLVGVECTRCKKTYYPEKGICQICKSSDDLKPLPLSPYGIVVSWSVLYVAPEGFEHLVPYAIALVKLKDGPTIFTQITDCDLDKLKKGMQVEAVFRKLMEINGDSIIRYGLKFRPIDW